MLEHDLEMACTKFHENWLIIDGQIDEKHALQIYQNKYVLDNFFQSEHQNSLSRYPRGAENDFRI